MADMVVKIRTNGNGYFQESIAYNPPGPFDLTVQLSGRLTSPERMRIRGTVDIDAADGSPTNQTKHFQASTGQQVSLGSWQLDGGDNVVRVAGQTIPPAPNTELTFELNARLGARDTEPALSPDHVPDSVGTAGGANVSDPEAEPCGCVDEIREELERHRQAGTLTKEAIEETVGAVPPTPDILELYARAPAAPRKREVFERFMGRLESGKSIYYSKNGKGNCDPNSGNPARACPPPYKFAIPRNAEYVSHRLANVNAGHKHGYKLWWDLQYVYVDVWAQGNGFWRRKGGWLALDLYCTFQRDL